jgi:light-regulated signal transduction histidine kinase (bacteriophytochrome)
MRYLDLVHPDDHERIAAAEGELVAGAAAYWPDTELRVRHRDGSYRWILFSGVVAAEERLLFVSGKDVSARNRAVAELAQFAYVASHDLSEPLRMISSYLQLLRRRYHGRLDDDADAFIDYAVDGAHRMRALIDDLLAYSRAGHSERPHEPVDTGQVVAEVAETLRAQACEERPDIEWSELPVVTGDAGLLRQLFQNVIGNGVKFVATAVHPRVRIAAVREGELWRFTVDDNGVGIAPHQIERVFGMFQRLHTRDEFEGTGIGLAIAKKVVENHGGTIHVRGRDRGGTRFEFTLPCQDEVR